MNRHDTWIISGAIVFTVLAGVWVQFIVGAGNYETGVAISLIDDIIDYFVLVAAVVTLAIVYKAHNVYGGGLARSLEMIGIGLLLYVPTYWLSYRWTIEGKPLWLGLTAEFWTVLFNLFTLATFTYIAYGFYLIWRLGTK